MFLIRFTILIIYLVLKLKLLIGSCVRKLLQPLKLNKCLKININF